MKSLLNKTVGQNDVFIQTQYNYSGQNKMFKKNNKNNKLISVHIIIVKSANTKVVTIRTMLGLFPNNPFSSGFYRKSDKWYHV